MKRGFLDQKEQKEKDKERKEKDRERKAAEKNALTTPQRKAKKEKATAAQRERRAAIQSPEAREVRKRNAEHMRATRASLASPEERAFLAAERERMRILRAEMKATLEAEQEEAELAELREYREEIMKTFPGNERDKEKCDTFFWKKVKEQRRIKNFHYMSACTFHDEPLVDWAEIQQNIRDKYNKLYSKQKTGDEEFEGEIVLPYEAERDFGSEVESDLEDTESGLEQEDDVLVSSGQSIMSESETETDNMLEQMNVKEKDVMID